MAEPKTTGTLTTVDDRPALRFERHLPCSVDRVWRAISQPAELFRWFPSPIVWTPALGEAFNIDGEIGEVVELRSPTLLGWTAGRERFHVEVLSARDGSLRPRRRPGPSRALRRTLRRALTARLMGARTRMSATTKHTVVAGRR